MLNIEQRDVIKQRQSLLRRDGVASGGFIDHQLTCEQLILASLLVPPLPSQFLTRQKNDRVARSSCKVTDDRRFDVNGGHRRIVPQRRLTLGRATPRALVAWRSGCSRVHLTPSASPSPTHSAHSPPRSFRSRF